MRGGPRETRGTIKLWVRGGGRPAYYTSPSVANSQSPGPQHSDSLSVFDHIRCGCNIVECGDILAQMKG